MRMRLSEGEGEGEGRTGEGRGRDEVGWWRVESERRGQGGQPASMRVVGEGDEPADQGVTLEETLGVLLVELEELTSGTTDLGEDEGDPPDLVLVLETVLTSELELGIETGRLERAPRDLVDARGEVSSTTPWGREGCIASSADRLRHPHSTL